MGHPGAGWATRVQTGHRALSFLFARNNAEEVRGRSSAEERTGPPLKPKENEPPGERGVSSSSFHIRY